MDTLRDTSGRFKTSPGRPKGSKNHNPTRVKNFCLKLFNANSERLQEDLDTLPPDKRVSALVELGKIAFH